jgi:hypothetical protein
MQRVSDYRNSSDVLRWYRSCIVAWNQHHLRMTNLLLPALLVFSATTASSGPATFSDQPSSTQLVERFVAPTGAMRVDVEAGSFAHTLRHLALKPVGSPVLLYSGRPKASQEVHAAVVDISTGTKDLQQCADAVMRLRAEYLYASGQQDAIAFNFTNGFRATWKRWRAGERIRVSGNTCTWVQGGQPDASHEQLLKYLELVFTYAGTLSLAKELEPAADKPLMAGDVFIQGGSPGHAVLVLDVARHPDGRVFFLLGQSYMPAQDFHVLRNTSDALNGAWFEYRKGSVLRTPEWTFAWSDRKRWP